MPLSQSLSFVGAAPQLCLSLDQSWLLIPFLSMKERGTPPGHFDGLVSWGTFSQHFCLRFDCIVDSDCMNLAPEVETEPGAGRNLFTVFSYIVEVLEILKVCVSTPMFLGPCRLWDSIGCPEGVAGGRCQAAGLSWWHS